MAENMLCCKGIVKSFGGVHALKGVDLIVKKGEVHCLAGENGCGKSTIIKAISGFQSQDSGTIEVDGVIHKDWDPIRAIEAGIQVIYQDLSIFPNLTVQENLAMNTVLSRKEKLFRRAEQKEIAEQALARLGLDIPLDVRVEKLPIADKQLIAIARALNAKAKLLILDEPTASLTKKEVERLFEIIMSLKKQGITILFVSHKLDEMFEISDSITIMRSGENVHSCPMKELTEEDFVYYMTGRKFENHEKNSEARIREDVTPVLEVKGLSGAGFENMSFSVKAGEILGIVGQLGSGRTELCNTLFGLLKSSGGQILIDGNPVRINHVQDAMKQKIALVPEDRLTEGLFLPMSIVDNITVVNFSALSKMGYLSETVLESESQRWVDDIHVATKDQALPVQTLSGGNQQKVVLAKWLSTMPKVLILNGPTVGVDIGAKYDIYDILRDLASKGMAILVASDDIAEIVKLCDRVVVMRSGKMAGSLDAEDVTTANLTELFM